MSNDPNNTLIPRVGHPRARFERTIRIEDQVYSPTAKRIAKLAPKSDNAQWVVVYAVAAVVFSLGMLTGYFLAHV